MQEQAGTRGDFFINVNLVFLSQIAIYGLAFLLRVVLARGLGDDGLGTYALFYLSVLIAGAVGNFGVGLGSIYFLNKGEHSLRELFSTSLFTIVVVGAVSAAAVVAYALVVDDEAFVSGRAYWLYAPTVTATVAYMLLTALIHGASRFLALAVIGVVQGLAALGIATGLLIADSLDVYGAVLAFLGSFALADILALALVGLRNVDLPAVVFPRWGVLRRQVGYGMQGQLSNLAQLFNYRLDQYLVAAFVARAAVGHYAVAVSVGESVWWISSAVAMVMLPRLTGLDKERADEVTPIVCRNTVFVSALGALALVAVSPLAIGLLFGDEFDPAVMPLMLLMPGVVAISAVRVIGSYLFSRGKVIYNLYTTVISLLATLAFGLILIPSLEIEGAAIASSLGYGIALVLSVWFYRRTAEAGIAELLLPTFSDAVHYRDLWRRFTARLSSRSKAVGAAEKEAERP
jgi:O-antigen/teichoic acid export membrane protein